MGAFWQPFLAAHPPSPAVAPLPEARIAEYAGRVPDALVAFWREVGVGSFGGGLIRVASPATLDDALALWLGARSPRRVPIARAAFGELYYWRDLREEARAKGMTGENPGELGDVSCVDVHTASIDVAALDVPELFELLADPEYIEVFLRGRLARASIEIYGPIEEHEQLTFVPALALGGVESLECVQKVAMNVQGSILRQLA